MTDEDDALTLRKRLSPPRHPAADRQADLTHIKAKTEWPSAEYKNALNRFRVF